MSNPNQVVVSQVSDVTTVELTTTGPQGPSFASTGTTMNDSGKVNNSVVYFDSTSGTFKADATRTVENLGDGGNF